MRGFIFIETTHPRWFLSTSKGRIASRHSSTAAFVREWLTGSSQGLFFLGLSNHFGRCLWMEKVDFNSSIVSNLKPSPFPSEWVCLDEHIEAPFKMAWSQNGRSNQPTHPPTNHCLGGLTGPSWFSTFPPPTSYGLSPPTPLHEGHCLGLVNELLGGAQETRCIDGGNAASDGDSLCTRGSCPESLLWRCKWQQNNGHCW